MLTFGQVPEGSLLPILRRNYFLDPLHKLIRVTNTLAYRMLTELVTLPEQQKEQREVKYEKKRGFEQTVHTTLQRFYTVTFENGAVARPRFSGDHCRQLVANPTVWAALDPSSDTHVVWKVFTPPTI